MPGIYLAAYRAYHPDYDILYQDINGKRDLGGDMLEYDLDLYDFVIASPPCNFWSKAIGSRQHSKYAIDTSHLLPMILNKLSTYNKPFIVENVRNAKKFNEYNLFDYPGVIVYFIGRHTYWTNVFFDSRVNQTYEDIVHTPGYNRQGGLNVHTVIESWLKEIHSDEHYIKL